MHLYKDGYRDREALKELSEDNEWNEYNIKPGFKKSILQVLKKLDEGTIDLGPTPNILPPATDG